MVRLSVGAVALAALVGCTGVIDTGITPGSGSGSGALTPEQLDAQKAWIGQAEPPLKQNCASCHQGQMGADIAFLGSPTDDDQTIRTTLLNFDPQLVDLDAIQSSRILVKGQHSGPPLGAGDASAILGWLAKEKIAASIGDTTPTLETVRFDIQPCTGGVAGDPTCPIMHVKLDALGLPGAEITFVAQLLSDGIYANEITLVASTDGAYIEHPLFVSHPTDPTANPIPDSLDRYFDVKLDLAASTSSLLDGGTAAFIGFLPSYQVSIIFQVVDKFRPDMGSGSGTMTGGCKVLDSFMTNAQPTLTSNCANACHGGANVSAQASMDLKGLLAATPDVANACAQVASRINLTDIESSGFFIEPNPGNTTNHPFKFGTPQLYTTFHDAVSIWANAEKVAP